MAQDLPHHYNNCASHLHFRVVCGAVRAMQAHFRKLGPGDQERRKLSLERLVDRCSILRSWFVHRLSLKPEDRADALSFGSNFSVY